MSGFKNAAGGFYLRGLFYETTEDKGTVIYTLKSRPHLGYPSLYEAYMAVADPTEYRFATAYLDGWAHWEALSECTWFKPYISAWRRELETFLRSQALASIIRVSADEANSNSYHANKYLLEGNWKAAGEKKASAGRPTKDSIKKAAHELLNENARIAEDATRILTN